MSFKFSTNFLLPYVRKPAKYGGRGSIGLDATPTVLIHICHPVHDVIYDSAYGHYCAALDPPCSALEERWFVTVKARDPVVLLFRVVGTVFAILLPDPE